MDVLDWVNAVLSEARWLSTPDEALSILPDVGVDAPAIVQIGSAHDAAPRMPVAFSDALREPVAEFMAARLADHIEDGVSEQISDITPDRLAKDKLVLALSSLLIEAAELGQRSTSLVMLELSRQTAAIGSGNLADLGRRHPVQKSQLERLLPRMAKLDPAKKGAILAKVAWSLSARLSFSWAMAGKLNPAARPTRLHQAIVRNKLALVLSRGGIQLPRDLALVAAITGVRTTLEHLTAVHAGLLGAIKHALKDDSAAAKTLRALAGSRKDPEALALDGAISGWVLNGLEDVAPSRVLAGAGVSRDQLKILTDRRAVPALASAWQRICKALRTWDLLTSSASLCLPIDLSTGTPRSVMGELRDGRPWTLLVPAGKGGSQELHVVGVDRTAVVEAAQAKSAERGVAVFAALSGVWLSLGEHLDGGVLSPASGPWFAVFEDGGTAREFARTVERRFRPPLQLDLAPLGPIVSLAPGAGVSAQVVSGVVLGGWTGESLAVRGPAVDLALGASGEVRAEPAPEARGSFIAPPEPIDPAPREALDEVLSRKAEPLAAPPEVTSDPPTDDPFSTGKDAGTISAGFKFGDGPGKPIEPAQDPFSRGGELEPEESGLSLGGDDPFNSAPAPAADAAADPFAQAPSAPKATPSLPPEPVADPSAFDDIEADPLAGPPSALSLADDPLVSNPPLSEDSLGLGGDDLGPDPFAASMDDDPEPADLEIVDDDDSEFTHDPESGGIFFLPPPPDAEIGTGEDDSSRTLVPEASLDSQLPADPENLLNLDAGATDSQFGFTDAAPELDKDAVESLVDDAEVVVDQPSEDRLGLEISGDAGFMVAGPAEPPPPPEPEEGEDDPFASDDPFGDVPERVEDTPSGDPFEGTGPLVMSTDDLRHLFDGYIWFLHDGQTVFGRTYGENRVVDVHRYETTDLEDALVRFLRSKAKERFVAQNDATMVVPKGAETSPLDTDALKGALSTASG